MTSRLVEKTAGMLLSFLVLSKENSKQIKQLLHISDEVVVKCNRYRCILDATFILYQSMKHK